MPPVAARGRASEPICTPRRWRCGGTTRAGGAGLIRVELATAFPDRRLTGERTLRAWFAAAGLGRPPRPPHPPDPPRATVPHARWQLDAVERLRLADGRTVGWLAASDEATGALRGGNDRPPDLAWWLLGLGVAVVWNRPRHKQGNAVIERAHGVRQRWVEPATCPDPATLQPRLDSFTALQCERYPACAGRSRLAAFPGLAHSGRPYDPAREAAPWDVRRVWRWLGPRIWTRRVDQVGRISLAGRALGVGKAHARTDVTVRLVVFRGAPRWTVRAADGTLLRHHPAPDLGRARIRARDVTHRRPRGKPCGHLGG